MLLIVRPLHRMPQGNILGHPGQSQLASSDPRVQGGIRGGDRGPVAWYRPVGATGGFMAPSPNRLAHAHLCV